MNLSMVELVLYQEHWQLDEILEKCKEYASIKKYAIILHDKDYNADGTPKKPHYHVYLHFGRTYDCTRLPNQFGRTTTMASLERIKGRWDDVMQYAIHRNAPTKHQYTIDEVHANFDYNKELEQIATKQTLDDVLLQVANGTLRPYQWATEIDDLLYINNARKIETAYQKYIGKVMNDMERKIDVYWVYGTTGTGKTTLAKMICKNQNWSYAVSSSNNDPLQDYKGQDVLILDDLRDNSFKFNDLLKILDNNTGSSMASRYSNKLFLGHTIIITSAVSLENWYNGVEQRNGNDCKTQLYRRITQFIDMFQEKMQLYTLNLETLQKENVQLVPNPVAVLKKQTERMNNKTRSVVLSVFNQMLESDDETYKELNEKIKLDDDDLPF